MYLSETRSGRAVVGSGWGPDAVVYFPTLESEIEQLVYVAVRQRYERKA